MSKPIIDVLPEPMALPDGSTVEFRAVSPADQGLIQAAVGRMSAETSARRFFTVRHQLSDLELHRLTDMDGWDRFAIGAVARSLDGSVEGVGVARFHRLADEPNAAEMALVVVDAYQRKGIGKRLLDALSLAARQRGIDRLRGIVQADNRPMLELLVRLAPGLVRVEAPEGVEVELPLEPQATAFA